MEKRKGEWWQRQRCEAWLKGGCELAMEENGRCAGDNEGAGGSERDRETERETFFLPEAISTDMCSHPITCIPDWDIYASLK